MKIVDCYRPKPPTAWAAAQTWHEGAPAPVQADFESVLPSIWWS